MCDKNTNRDQLVRSLMLGKELIYKNDGALLQVTSLSKQQSATHVNIVISGFLSEGSTGESWTDAFV
jgi:hypothetical protein